MDQRDTTLEYSVRPLFQQCLHYIAMHLEEFPVSQLSLLPVKTREELLWRLPIADLCQLEDTEYVTGIQDMAAYWKKPCEQFFSECKVPAENKDTDIGCYEQEWDETEYARAVLYGQVATVAIGCSGDDFWFTLPNGEWQGDDNVLEFLYTVRNLYNEECDLVFPPRYSHQRSNVNVIEAIVSCFKGELPKVLGGIMLDNVYVGDVKYADFLKHAIYIGIHGEPFNESGLEFVKAVLRESAYGCLEVLVLEGLAFWLDEQVSLNELCSFLSTQTTFLSRFRMLKILSYPENGHGFTIYQGIFDKLVAAYFSARTDHAQKLHFKDTKIRCGCDSHHSPTVDQRYLQFKTIKLDNCKFITKSHSTPKAISHWIGQDISVLENNEGSCTFRVKEKESSVGKKRKFSELVYDN